MGIIQEQHPDRCRLFMQWQRMQWPVLVDALNLYGVSAVPLTYAIDEAGVVRAVNPKAAELEAFLSQPAPAATLPASARATRPDLAKLRSQTREDTPGAWRAYADALFLWGGDERLGEAIAAYGRALELVPGDGPTEFRLGVALRRRHDSPAGEPGDFQAAALHWARALEADPNQYIWRRRIQQFGPRLGKPYPFYDWVGDARAAMRARGEEPLALVAEPSGAEVAAPAERFAGFASTPEPDAAGRVRRDDARLIRVETAVVPPAVGPAGVTRAHLLFRPSNELEAHWNNEAEPLRVYLRPPAGWTVDQREAHAPQPATALSEETRDVQFEIQAPAAPSSQAVSVPGYALYYVCQGQDGVCLYRRQDFVVSVAVR